MGTNTEIKLASIDQTSDIKDLLAHSDLPHEDIARHFQHFHVAIDEDRVIGTIGLETYGASGLLRSLAVLAPFRGQGHARRLYEQLESYARAEGVTALYLLTLTAVEFFVKVGFVEIDRHAVPDEIKNTREFTVVCPSTATCMMKRLV